ncbi:SPOR domain-containing protein [Pseudomonas syringae]|nr:SPOR domain-containing protein [Pseudomonas syringae]MBD8576631.1 SPOR domain-containing protein [Pseudomonas syringae]MBD8788508.1 SPOR domain-containing protein [Pseudomonas syringae]MBD8799292.1 SPOR domain-containing protein [Pseudomonas syringae]MBD8811489.1 SPOR domain-containing protein [Pseudomonas syringae]
MAVAKKKAAPKRGASRYQAPAKKPIPGWVWLAVGLTVGAFIVFLMKLEPGGDDIKREKADAKAAAKIAEANKTPPSPAVVKPKYDFYTLLPESEVIVPKEAVPEKTPPAPAVTPVAPVTAEQAAKIDTARAQAALSGLTPPPAPAVATAQPKPAPVTQFFLQAGSFRKQADAEKVRAQIILLGQTATVESGTVKEETWYRVLVGPFSNRDQLTIAQKQLAGGGFSNLLLQQRQKR